MTTIGPYNLPTILPSLKCEPTKIGTLIPSNTLLAEIMIKFPQWFLKLKPYIVGQEQNLTLFLIPIGDNIKDIIVPGKINLNTIFQSPLITLTALSGNNLIIDTRSRLTVNKFVISGSIYTSDGILYF